MQQILLPKCEGCGESFRDNRPPVTLVCSHNICMECLGKVDIGSEDLKCPKEGCETKHPQGVSAVKTNTLLLSMIESMSCQHQGYFCSTHQDKPIEFYCLEHQRFLCRLDFIQHNEHFPKNYNPIFQKEDIRNEAQELIKFMEHLTSKLELHIKGIRKILNYEITDSNTLSETFHSCTYFLQNKPQPLFSKLYQQASQQVKRMEERDRLFQNVQEPKREFGF